MLFDDKAEWAAGVNATLREMGPTWEKYQQLLHFYLRGDWKRFSRVGRDLFRAAWKEPSNQQERHILALQPAYLFLLPVLPGNYGHRMLEEHAQAVLSVQACNPLAAWVHVVEEDGSLATLQRDLLDCLRSYIDQWETWAPGLIYAIGPSGGRGLESLVLARDDFVTLRDTFVHTYETCCQALPYAIALMNAANRGDPNAFPDVPEDIRQDNSKARPPLSIEAFRRVPNANKMKWFIEWEQWTNVLPTILDKDLRNAIGHATAKHNISTGNVESDKFIMPYGMLASKVLLLGHVLLIMLQVVKTLRLMAADWSAESVEEDATTAVGDDQDPEPPIGGQVSKGVVPRRDA